MKTFPDATTIALVLALSACGSSGNLRSTGEYDAPPAPTLTHPYYNPYAANGDERANWRPEVVDREGQLVRPREPAIDYGRAGYESAPWAIDYAKAPAAAPLGTF